MRIPFPERVNLSHALVFATGLGAVELLQGTNPFFVGCIFCFILVASMGFNIAGGFPFPSGAYIGFNAFFTLILPLITKAILGEAADSNLRAPLRTIEVYLIGMVGMLVAAIVSRKFRKRKAVISDMLPEDTLHSAYVGCAVFAVLLTMLTSVLPYGGNGSVVSFLVQFNRFPLLTVVLGVFYTIRRSNGRRSVSWPLLAMILFTSLGALVTFSKEQFFTPLFAWAITAALLRYKLHRVNFLVFGAGVLFVVGFMFPYAQYGRNLPTDLSPIQQSAYLLTHPGEVRQGYEESNEVVGDVHYYDKRLGLLDRLNLIATDDALIDVTDRIGTFGFLPLQVGFENMIPHALWANKPMGTFGNDFAHEIGILADTDTFTGVSFSPSADAYHEGSMVGILVAEPLVLILIFLVLDSVIGDVRFNPVGLLTTIVVTRASFEGALWFSPSLIGQSLFTNVVAAYVCAYILPVLGSFFNRPFVRASSPPLHATPTLSTQHPVSSL